MKVLAEAARQTATAASLKAVTTCPDLPALNVSVACPPQKECEEDGVVGWIPALVGIFLVGFVSGIFFRPAGIQRPAKRVVTPQQVRDIFAEDSSASE